ncbi:MAG: transglutaminase domain-containing protein [Bacteroidales bacterium]|nr:transglutaminase domain-containing protein [Bacteroidales bacterium]
MKTFVIMKRWMVALAICLIGIASAKAQGEKLAQFQKVVTEYQTCYQSAAWNGNHKDAIEPLKTLINLLDTTTVFVGTQIPEGAVIEQKGMYLYDLACCYAMTGQKKLALEALTKSVDCGYKQYNNMLNDNDLISLRKDKKYQALLAKVKERRPLNVLRNSALYAKDDAEIEFLYQPKESNNLCLVRDYFNLDSVAGEGDELSKIINLLHFAHDNIRHDGSNRAIAEMDAIDLYNYYKTTGKGVNCRQLAISLCEMYLSLGIPARYVTCMPADSLDYECHVINTVWSSQLEKWLYIDPTMDAWLMDENGTMLSIAEVRERLINDQPLVLCETANWNHEQQQTKEYYIDDYMAKNLYYFVCKKLNRFNPESIYRYNDPKDDVRLIPEGFVNNNWKCDTTTDPDVFWARPK